MRIAVPFTPGGTTDILARALGAELQEAFGQTFIVDNRGGAGDTIGSTAVARAAPDGHTPMMGQIGTLAVNPALHRLPYDTAAAFDPIVPVAVVPNMLVVNPRKVEARSVPELVARAKQTPRGASPDRVGPRVGPRGDVGRHPCSASGPAWLPRGRDTGRHTRPRAQGGCMAPARA